MLSSLDHHEQYLIADSVRPSCCRLHQRDFFFLTFALLRLPSAVRPYRGRQGQGSHGAVAAAPPQVQAGGQEVRRGASFVVGFKGQPSACRSSAWKTEGRACVHRFNPFHPPSRTQVNAELGGQYSDVMSAQDIAVYGGLCALATFDRWEAGKPCKITLSVAIVAPPSH